MTRSELERTKAKADAVRNTLIDEMIAVGRGNELLSETCKKTDALSLRYIDSANNDHAIAEECRRRMEYHGDLHKT